MPDYRARLSQTLTGSLKESETHESNVTRLTAFAVSTDAIAGPLWRVKYDLDSSVLGELVGTLARLYGTTVRLAELSLHEHLSSSCESCQGRGQLKDGRAVVIECKTCAGTGIRRHSDRSRAHYLQTSMAQARRHAKTLTKLASALGAADKLLNARMSDKLA